MKSAKNNAHTKAMPHHEYVYALKQERKAEKHKRSMRKASVVCGSRLKSL